MFLAVDLAGNLVGLFSGADQNAEFVAAVLAVPDGEGAAAGHRHAHFADVFGNLVAGHSYSLTEEMRNESADVPPVIFTHPALFSRCRISRSSNSRAAVSSADQTVTFDSAGRSV